MQFLKVSCAQCSKYHECPQKTRMFVNYCGSDSRNIKDSIREAVLDCRTRQGKLLKRTLISDVQIATFPVILAPVVP